MALDFDLYLIGPAPGVSVVDLRRRLVGVFGELPTAFLNQVGARPVRVKAAVDLVVAQQYVDTLKTAGAVVKMVRAGSGHIAEPQSGPMLLPVDADDESKTSEIDCALVFDPALGYAMADSSPGTSVSGDDAHDSITDGIKSAVVPVGVITPAEVGLRAMPGHVEATPYVDVHIELPRIGAESSLRSDRHKLAMARFDQLQVLADQLHHDLALGVLGGRSLDQMVAGYISKKLRLGEPVQLYFTEPLDRTESRSTVTGVALGTKFMAWSGGQVTLDAIVDVLVTCDGVNSSPRIVIRTALDEQYLPLLDGFQTMMLAATVAGMTETRRLWISPMASYRLRRPISDRLHGVVHSTRQRGPVGNLSRRAVGLVRRYWQTVIERYSYWQDARGFPGDSPDTPGEALRIVVAPEFWEVEPRLHSHSVTLVMELLFSVRPKLDPDEGILALFCLRDETWEPAPGLDARMRSAVFLQRDSRAVSSANGGDIGVLTTRRLVIFRSNESAPVSVPLGAIEEVGVSDGHAPRLFVRFLDHTEQKRQFRVVPSGNLMFPVFGTPLDHVERLANRIREAQEFDWDRRHFALQRESHLPQPPPWLERVAAAHPNGTSRVVASIVQLMRQPTTPRSVRRLAQVGSGIQMADLRGLRERLAESTIDVSGVGTRFVFLPGKLFERDDDGLLASEGYLLVAGLGEGRIPWPKIRGVLPQPDGRWMVGTILTEEGELSLRSRDADVIYFLSELLSVVVHTAG